MKGFLLCVYLCVVFSTVHSASYYYRAGREIIEPTVEETIREVISEVKKEDVPAAVIVDEIVAVKNAAESVAPLVPVEVPENVVVPNVLVTEVVDEARGKIVPQQLRLETLDVIQPSGGKAETVADTVKNAAVEAIRATNEEIVINEIVKPVEVVPETVAPVVPPVSVDIETKQTGDVVDIVPVVKAVPVANVVVDSVKSEPVVEAVKVVETVVAPVEAVVPAVVETVKSGEVLRAAVPEPEAQSPEAEVAPSVTKVDEPTEEKQEVVQDPAVRQSAPAQQPNPIQQFATSIQNQFSTLASQIPVFGQLFGAGTNSANRPQADTAVTAADAVEQSAISDNIAPIAEATPAPASSPASFLQPIIAPITNLLQRVTPTTAPPAVEVAAVSDTRHGDDTVQIVQNIEVDDVDDKVDYTKKGQ